MKFSGIAYFLLVSAFLTAWAPLKPLAYLVPLGFIVLIVFYSRDKFYPVAVLRLSLVLGVLLVVLMLTASFNSHFSYQNAIISLVTYAWMILVIMLPFDQFGTQKMYDTAHSWSIILLALQSSIGFLQAIAGFLNSGSFDLSNGDRVEGTIHLALPASSSFSNVIFAFNMVGLLLFLVPKALSNKSHLTPLLIFGALVLLLASVVHLILFLVLAVAISYLLFLPPIRIQGFFVKWTLRFVGVAFPVLALVILSTNLSNLSTLSTKLLSFESPKSKVLKEVFVALPDDYPVVPWIGIGPGQFSSRASLIGSGYYFGGLSNPTDLPGLTSQTTYSMNKYILPKWIWVDQLPFSAGSTMKPYSSWISVISEFGLLVFIAIVLVMIVFILRLRIMSNSDDKKIAGFVLSTYMIFFFASGFQENYWEIPQMFLAGALSMLVLYQYRFVAHLDHESSSTH
ncbi:MAG: hypothetical protein AAGC88_03470 [Bacteroidota bacterium]